MQEVQTEYGLAYMLTAAFILFGVLLVCIPRPRKKDFEDPRKKSRRRGKARKASK
jgi:hypothetical protein